MRAGGPYSLADRSATRQLSPGEHAGRELGGIFNGDVMWCSLCFAIVMSR